MHNYSVISFQDLIYDPRVSLGITSPQLIKKQDTEKGNNEMCDLMHNHCPFWEKILPPPCLVISLSVGSLSLLLFQLRSFAVEFRRKEVFASYNN